VAPTQQLAPGQWASGPAVGLRGTGAREGQQTAVRFFGSEVEAPKPKKEKPFKLPPLFTTLASFAALVGLCAYFVNNA